MNINENDEIQGSQVQDSEENENDKKLRDKFKEEFLQDVEHRKVRHQMNNFHYLQYKGILKMNQVYGKNFLESTGLMANVPRTFMTIESIRPILSGRPLDISAKAHNKKEYDNRDKAEDILKGEWARSKADYAKADAEWDALLLGSGFLLWRYDEIVEENTDLFDGYDEEGKIKYRKGRLEKYKGMRLIRLDPYYVFPDHTATTDDEGEPGSWGHCYVYSIWDFDEWKNYCEQKGFNTKGMEKDGHLEDFGAVRNAIDSIYSLDEQGQSGILTTRDNGKQVSGQLSKGQADMKNKIAVIERFESNSYIVCSGKNWTLNHKGVNPNPDKRIPIKVIRDYRIPSEFDGIGEPEVIRWQQYEENKVHNLAYMSVLMNTVQRYGILEEYLKDPTAVRFNNPFRPILLKEIPGKQKSVRDIIQPLDQKSSNDLPDKFLQYVKDIGQSATGITDFFIGANKARTDTLGEAEMMQGAGSDRIQQKIFNIEERDLVPVCESWLACIPQFYTEEMDVLLNDGEDYHVKYVPYTRDFNTDQPTIEKVQKLTGANGETVEQVYLNAGYRKVIFVSDIIGRYNIILKTATASSERRMLIDKFMKVIEMMGEANKMSIASKVPPEWDVNKPLEDILRQFPEIVKNPDEYKLKIPQQKAEQNPVNPMEMPPTEIPQTDPAGEEAPPTEEQTPQPPPEEALVSNIPPEKSSLPNQ